MPRLRTLILLLGDILLLAAAYLAAYVVIFKPLDWYDASQFLIDDNGLISILLLTGIILFAMYLLGLYQRIRIQSRRDLAEDLMLVFGVCFVLQAFFSFTRGFYALPRSISLLGALLAFGSIIIWRTFYSSLLLRVSGLQKVLFWGDTKIARDLAHHLIQYPEKGFRVAGLVSTEDFSALDEGFPSSVVLYLGSDLFDQIKRINPDRVCVSGTISPSDPLGEPLLKLSMLGITVESAGDLHELVLQRVCLETLTLNQLIFSPQFRPARWKILCQNLYGSILALIGILITWPLMILAAIAIRLDSPGPALLRQRRVGRNGAEFEILKFRSMYIDGDARFGTIRADKQDPRITRVGRFIRVTRIDELPQFFNVLRGEMAFVGPRPEMPVYTEKLTRGLPLYPQRLRVKPGITGWAQLFHEPEITLEQTRRKVEYDLYYIKNMSPLMDFLILFHTIRTVLYRTGAR
jgi:exopolysaccharide biosynthesis polyprenyl glycosylphosphotransferase